MAGVGEVIDIKELARPAVVGVIVGRSPCEGRFSLTEAVSAVARGISGTKQASKKSIEKLLDFILWGGRLMHYKAFSAIISYRQT